MRYLGTLVICVLLVGLTASAFAELRSAEVNGSVRVRGIWVGSPAFDADNNDVDFVEQRTRMGVEATFTDDVHAFIEFQMSSVWGTEVPLDEDDPWEEDEGDVVVYQSYIQADDMFDYPISMKVGRQEMVYGTELLIGNSDFTQFGLAFDAVKLMYEDGDLAVDVWWSKLVELGPVESDADDDFYGIYGTYSGVEDTVLDAYLLLIRQANHNNALMTDTDNQYTLGARAEGVCPWMGLGYNAEVATQFGEDGMGDDYEGWLLDVLIDYKIEADYNPAVFAGYTFSQGDGSTNDSDHERFSFPFTDNHKRWGYSDLFELGNLNVIRVGGSMCPTDDLTVIVQGLWFLAHQDEDMLVLGGVEVPSESDDDSVAQEIDVSLVYDYTEDLQFEVTYGHVFTDDWLEDSISKDDDVDILYAQASVSF